MEFSLELPPLLLNKSNKMALWRNSSVLRPKFLGESEAQPWFQPDLFFSLPYEKCNFWTFLQTNLIIDWLQPSRLKSHCAYDSAEFSPAKEFIAIQIMIGLIHIGFGAVSLCFYSYYFAFSALGGYPFWGGIFFISSGSVCVAAAKHPNNSLVKSSVGLNITCAVMSLTGIVLYLCELIISSIGYRYDYHYNGSLIDIGYGLSSVLLLFSLLEFCIAVSLAHFGCQAACCIDAQPTMAFVPYFIGDGPITTIPNPPPAPPTYNDVVTKSQ